MKYPQLLDKKSCWGVELFKSFCKKLFISMRFTYPSKRGFIFLLQPARQTKGHGGTDGWHKNGAFSPWHHTNVEDDGEKVRVELLTCKSDSQTFLAQDPSIHPFNHLSLAAVSMHVAGWRKNCAFSPWHHTNVEDNGEKVRV